DRVEPDSGGDKAGLQLGDRIVKVNGRSNGGVLIVQSKETDAIRRAESIATEQGATIQVIPDSKDWRTRIVVDDPKKVLGLKNHLNSQLLGRVHVSDTDVFNDLINSWPRGDQSLDLEVERDGQAVHVGPFTPRTLGLHPTQVYETVSMILLMFFLVAYFPFRRYDGQVFTLFIVGYAIHRFLNESLRNDTETVAFGMTLSQNISVLMLLFAACLEIGRRWATRGTR